MPDLINRMVEDALLLNRQARDCYVIVAATMWIAGAVLWRVFDAEVVFVALGIVGVIAALFAIHAHWLVRRLKRRR